MQLHVSTKIQQKMICGNEKLKNDGIILIEIRSITHSIYS